MCKSLLAMLTHFEIRSHEYGVFDGHISSYENHQDNSANSVSPFAHTQ